MGTHSDSRRVWPRSAVVSVATAVSALALTATAGAALLPPAGPDALPPHKEALERGERALQAAATRAPKPPWSGHARVPVLGEHEEAPVTGIVDWLDAPYSSAEFTPTNSWGGFVGTSFVRVYAGTTPRNPRRGVLAVIVSPVDAVTRQLLPGRRRGRLVKVPFRFGVMRIASADGTRLTLAAADGNTIVYEIERGAFSAP